MYTLILSSWELPGGRALARAARTSGARVFSLEETPEPEVTGAVAYWGDGEVGLKAARRFGLALLEPPFDLLARLPYSLRLRAVEYCRFGDLQDCFRPLFLKPADCIRKVFDAGVYTALDHGGELGPVSPATTVLVSEPVEWLAEYRCFVQERKVTAISPYLSFGHPSWRPYVPGSGPVRVPPQVTVLCERLLVEMGGALPPACVVDVGLIDERGWAVVEFNPVWCAGLLGCDPRAALPALRRATRNSSELAHSDWRWVIRRPGRK